MKDNIEMSQESRLLVLLFQVQHLAFEAVESEFWQYGISTQQALALFIIQSLGGSATPSELSRRLMRRPNSISAILSRMEKTGLVKVGGNPDRKGAMRATITDKGKQAFDDARERIKKMDVQFIEEVDPVSQALLEIYSAYISKAKYNDFDTH